MSNEVNIEIRELHNKSRDGVYAYVRSKGLRPAYYKYYPGQNLDSYRSLYLANRSLPNRKRFVTKSYVQTETNKNINLDINSTKDYKATMSNIDKYPRINDFIKKKFTFIDTDIKKLINSKEELTRLMEPVILDKKILERVISMPNAIKSRLMNKISIIAESESTGENITFCEIVVKGRLPNEIRETLLSNLESEFDYSYIEKLGSAFNVKKESIKAGLINKNDKYILKDIKIQIVFA